MKILVCVKQVADTESRFTLSDSGREIIYGDKTVFRMNRFDEFALEEALRISEAIPGAEVEVLSAGPQRVAKTIRRGLEMGARAGHHLLMDEFACMDPAAVAFSVASFAAGRGFDLIFTGAMAEDDMQGQIGSMVAELLGYSCATSVMFQQVDVWRNLIYAEREIDASTRDCLELSFPAVLAIQSGINRPRYPSLTNVLRAKGVEIPAIEASRLADGPAAGEPPRYRLPDASKKGIVLEGATREKAERLLEILHEKSLM